jgi:hypothetical protein
VTTRQLWIAALAGLAAMVALDLVLGATLPGFYAALGLFGCLLLIAGSKWLGKRALQRDPGYYEDHPDGGEGG